MLFQYVRRRTVHRKKPDCSFLDNETLHRQFRRHREQSLRIIELKHT